jgi:hypothetical protein
VTVSISIRIGEGVSERGKLIHYLVSCLQLCALLLYCFILMSYREKCLHRERVAVALSFDLQHTSSSLALLLHSRFFFACASSSLALLLH